jgi:cobalt-zinc-cadmium efflux system membrane fusion protein
MNIRFPVLIFALVVWTAHAACSRRNSAEASDELPPEADVKAGHGGKGDAATGEVSDASEPSDLDRPLEELVGLTCEHHKKTYQCDECRYEVGFVRVPATLIEDGLVTTTKAERRRVAMPIVLTGEIRFDERRLARLGTQLEGIIQAVRVTLGDRVEKGQALLEIESPMVSEAQADFLDAQSMLMLARRNFERVAELRKENISSEKEFLQSKQELETAEIRAAGARSKLTRLRAVGTEGGRIVLRAPFEGTVLAMHAVPGEVAKTGESLITVGDNTTVWVWADLYEHDIAAVKQAQAAQKLAASISVKAYPGEEFPGTVDLISPAMDESSRTVKVRVQVKNADGRLLAGMFATVKLFLAGSDETLAVPLTAVLDDQGRSFVFVHYQGEYFVRRPVVRGRAWAGWVEIKDGLEPSQTVVVEGAFLLKSDVLRSKMGAGCAD